MPQLNNDGLSGFSANDWLGRFAQQEHGSRGQDPDRDDVEHAVLVAEPEQRGSGGEQAADRAGQSDVAGAEDRAGRERQHG